jgi:hypothetical protein
MNIRHISCRVKVIELMPWHHVFRQAHKPLPSFQQVIPQAKPQKPLQL